MRIKDIREDNDLRQSDVAEKLNITRQQYQRYESGVTPVPVDVLIKLSQIYNVSVDYLLGLTDQKKPYAPALDDRTQKLISYWKRLMEDEQDYIMGEMARLNMQRNGKNNKKKDIG